MFTTLISTAELGARVGDPGDPSLVIVDVRHDLAQPDALGRERVPSGAPARCPVRAPRPRPVRAPGPGATAAIRCPTAEACARVFGRLGIDATKQVVAYDQGAGHVRRAAVVDAALRWVTKRRRCSTGASPRGRARAGRSRPTLPEFRETSFVPRGLPATVEAPAIAANLATPSFVLLDARARERYRGDVEPLDPVAGHIPGALNRPYLENLEPDGRFKSAAALATEFDALLAGRAASDVVHYCGSGVTACHNLLAMTHAGRPGARLYPGSWSEWCSDPQRPVARGDT